MENSSLFKIAFLCSLIGIFIIFIISEKYSLADSNIGKVLNSTSEVRVSIKGEVVAVKELPNVLLLDVKDSSGIIKVVAFPDGNVSIEKNSVIEVFGTLKEYRNNIEVEADLIKVL